MSDTKLGKKMIGKIIRADGTEEIVEVKKMSDRIKLGEKITAKIIRADGTEEIVNLDFSSSTDKFLSSKPETGKEKKELIPYIPTDKKKYPQYQEIFDRRITSSFTKGVGKDEEGKKFITYTIQIKGGELTYQFYEDIISKELGQDTTKKLPTLGRRANRLWFSMIYFAKKQGNGLEGNFTASELMRLWGVDPDKRGGISWENIRETFLNIVAVIPYFTNQRSGDERTEWGFAFTSGFLIKGEGKETRYHYILNPEALGLTEKWLKGELTIEEIKNKGGYLAYPVAYLQGGLDETEQTFRDYLLKFKGGYTIKAFTVLNDWLKLRKDLLRRRKYCHRLLYSYLENAKKRGEITSYKLEVKTLSDWQNKWRITIYKPTKDKTEAKQRKGNKTNTEELKQNQQEKQRIKSFKTTNYTDKEISLGVLVDKELKNLITDKGKDFLDFSTLPEKLQTEEFKEAWLDWIKYKQEIGHPLKQPNTIKKHLKFLIEQPDPVACIEQSIRNSWEGLSPVQRRNIW